VVERPETVASAIRIGNPASWQGALAARDESGGAIDTVSDAEIVDAYRLLARTEGLHGEPASAVCVAGLVKAASRGMLRRGEVIVCTITGHGLKDPDMALRESEKPLRIPADLGSLARFFEGDEG
jgi:threonine synthase